MKVLYTARTHTKGGRDGGVSRSSDGRLEVNFSPPGGHGSGTNPEQLFAAGWSACYIGALGVVARNMKVDLPVATAVDAEVDLCRADAAYFIRARMTVSLPGLDREIAEFLVETAHRTCPYSKATHGNIEIVTNVL